MTLRWAIATPTGTPGAIAALWIASDHADELDHALRRVAGPAVPPGAISVRDLCEVDRGVVARWSPTRAEVMPHAGIAITRSLTRCLTDLLGPPCTDPDPAVVYPEASDDFEARMLTALARAPSPRAIDLLLDQPRRWREHAQGGQLAHGGFLSRLLDPPLVVAIGPPNVGKSSLLNALAGRCVAITSDEPGTTRDHVGVLLELDGLAVRYADTPGIGGPPGPGAAQAEVLARSLSQRADLVLQCFDAATTPRDAPPGIAHLRIATRSDLGLPSHAHDLAISAATGSGIDALARAIRGRLVPDAALTDPRPWRFWAPPHPGPARAANA